MKDTLKEIRYPLVALFLLTLLTAFTLAERQRLTVATLSVETKEVANLLLEAKAADLNLVLDKPDSYEANQLRMHDATARQGNTQGAIDFLSDYLWCGNGCSYQFPMVTGGSLQLKVLSTAQPRFQKELKTEQERNAGWEKVVESKRQSEAVQKAVADHTYYQIAGKDKPRHRVASTPSPPSDKPVEFIYTPKVAPLFYVDALVSNPATSPGTIGPSRQFVVTNSELQQPWDTFLQAVFTTYKSGKLQAYLQTADNVWDGPFDSKALTSSALQDARPFGVTSDNLAEVYREMRKKYEQQEVTLPGIGITVRSNSFIAYAFGLAVGLAAWGSFLLRRIRQTFAGEESEPWALVEPIRAFRQGKLWDRPIAAIEILLFTGFHLVAFLTPVAIAAMLSGTDQFEDPWLRKAGVTLGALMSLSMLANYLAILWMAAHSTIGVTSSKETQITPGTEEGASALSG